METSKLVRESLRKKWFPIHLYFCSGDWVWLRSVARAGVLTAA